MKRNKKEIKNRWKRSIE